MELKNPRVRFAPAPTGMMHLGNIRTALMNYLIAKQKNGTFIIRVEDTDPERNFDPGAVKIMEDLAWLGLEHQEGPGKDGGFGPYFQSERTELYKKKLQEFVDKDLVYRCFCTSEELDKKRARQIALKKPPRYDRGCLQLSKQASDTKAETTPFIWRMKLDHKKKLTINDLSHDTVTFDLSHFSDFPITRQNGSVTFMFANFVDDSLMNITCAIRGEDHLSNTAGQAAMYDASGQPMPAFWHMPILCNIDGKKLSKRDFGFSLRDLKDAGFLSEAIINYLAIIGGSFKNEIMSIEELTQAIDFEHLPTTGQIKYDVDKLRWINHKWICKTDTLKITQLCRPYLEENYPEIKNLSDEELSKVIEHVKKEIVTLQDCVQLLAFYFADPVCSANIAHALVDVAKRDAYKELVIKALTQTTGDAFLKQVKTESKSAGIKPKEAFSYLRYALTGSPKGIGLGELLEMLGYDISKNRIEKLLKL
ncbi:MAG: nondiscriminating glutamyl-tRNA synthetase [Alteromonas naphthalenivorans]|jgi:nondiscriminating glutamyl-tRNA synthetase